MVTRFVTPLSYRVANGGGPGGDSGDAGSETKKEGSRKVVAESREEPPPQPLASLVDISRDADRRRRGVAATTVTIATLSELASGTPSVAGTPRASAAALASAVAESGISAMRTPVASYAGPELVPIAMGSGPEKTPSSVPSLSMVPPAAGCAVADLSATAPATASAAAPVASARTPGRASPPAGLLATLRRQQSGASATATEECVATEREPAAQLVPSSSIQRRTAAAGHMSPLGVRPGPMRQVKPVSLRPAGTSSHAVSSAQLQAASAGATQDQGSPPASPLEATVPKVPSLQGLQTCTDAATAAPMTARSTLPGQVRLLHTSWPSSTARSPVSSRSTLPPASARGPPRQQQLSVVPRLCATPARVVVPAAPKLAASASTPQLGADKLGADVTGRLGSPHVPTDASAVDQAVTAPSAETEKTSPRPAPAVAAKSSSSVPKQVPTATVVGRCPAQTGSTVRVVAPGMPGLATAASAPSLGFMSTSPSSSFVSPPPQAAAAPAPPTSVAAEPEAAAPPAEPADGETGQAAEGMAEAAPAMEPAEPATKSEVEATPRQGWLERAHKRIMAGLSSGTELAQSIETLLQQLAGDHEGPLVRICVLGGTALQCEDSEELIAKMASELAAASLGDDVCFLTGGMSGVQQAFAENCGDGLQVWNLLPEGQESGFRLGRDVHAGTDLEQRKEIFAQLGDIYIAAEGGKCVAMEAKMAFERGAAIVPLMRSGGASSGLFGFPAAALERPSFATAEEWELLKSADAPLAESAAAAAAVVARLAATTRQRLAGADPLDGRNEAPVPTTAPAAAAAVAGPVPPGATARAALVVGGSAHVRPGTPGRLVNTTAAAVRKGSASRLLNATAVSSGLSGGALTWSSSALLGARIGGPALAAGSTATGPAGAAAAAAAAAVASRRPAADGEAVPMTPGRLMVKGPVRAVTTASAAIPRALSTPSLGHHPAKPVVVASPVPWQVSRTPCLQRMGSRG